MEPKEEIEIAKLAVELYPSFMKLIDVWKLIIIQISGICYVAIFTVFVVFAVIASCKALWWVIFVWKF
jgi:hypothetical protein